MDPNANLETTLELANSIVEGCEGGHVPVEEASDLAEHVIALDGWLTNGGFLPAKWNTAENLRGRLQVILAKCESRCLDDDEDVGAVMEALIAGLTEG